jgi:serine/threonine protein kinase
MHGDGSRPHDTETAGFDAEATTAVPAAAEPRIPVYPYYPGESILPGYRLDKRLGTGGFGEVWRATAPGGMGVAIKILANLGRAQGGREYRALQTIKNIRHAHIVPIFGVWLKSGDGRVLDEAELLEAEQRLLASRGSQGRPEQPGLAATVDAPTGDVQLESLELVIAMGLGDQTLSDRLREHGKAGDERIPVVQLLDWMHQGALALDHFNSGDRRRGENATAVQHCDIKPQNMLLVGDAVQVCDFGLARAQGEVRATSNTMASLAYAAPEMVSGNRDPAVTTDQYSLAVTYLELRTGRLPYAELSPGDILRAKLDGTLDLRRLPEAEADVVGRALAVDPALRWPSCVEFVRALRAAAQAGDGGAVIALQETTDAPAAQAAAVGSTAPPAGPVDRRRWLVTGGLLALAALGVVAGLFPWRDNPPPPSRQVAESLEKESRFAEAGDAYVRLLGDKNAELATVLWDLQTQAADAGRTADCIPLLRRLEQLYAATPPPEVRGLTRWDVVNSLAWYLSTDPALGGRAASDARRLAAESLTLAGDDAAMLPQALDTAAAAAARSGLFDEAIPLIERAIAAAPDDTAREDFERRRAAYRAGRAWSAP